MAKKSHNTTTEYAPKLQLEKCDRDADDDKEYVVRHKKKPCIRIRNIRTQNKKCMY